jgi:hypothetical protein
MCKLETAHTALILSVKQATWLLYSFMYFLFCYEKLVMDRYSHEDITRRSERLRIWNQTY